MEIFTYETPVGLVERILSEIATVQYAHIRRRMIMLGTLAATSFIVFLGTMRYAWQQFSSSEFSHYFSLIFSDRADVIMYWKTFLATLAESLPLLAITLVLAAAVIVLSTLRGLMRNYPTFQALSV